jgi:hypothetical protein
MTFYFPQSPEAYARLIYQVVPLPRLLRPIQFILPLDAVWSELLTESLNKLLQRQIATCNVNKWEGIAL